jgi:signal transduction histidine kinase
MVTVPITVGSELLGTLGLGFPLDDALAAELKAATESEVVVGVGGRVVASTLPRASDPLLAPLLAARGPSAVVLDGEEFVALARPLEAPLAAGETVPTALVLRSRTEGLRLLRTFRVGLVAAGLLGLVFAVALSYAVARTVTRPLSAISAAMREISATGDLARKVGHVPGWTDADTRLLASTLDSLTDALARFQRDAAQRERLSALGRMSSVVAHEVRNPLLVVKASLRTLKRRDLAPAEREEALSDIEAEVARLDRIVDDVLDFTRPVRVDLAPADLADVCREAVEAARLQDEGVRAAVRVAGPVPLLTDAERVRAVLANVLANAREAVAARATKADGEWDVEVRVEPGGGDRPAAIEVEDRGVGMEAADLPRAFEPYFTTKRAGTGLGLAIARNVVESLGGSIALRSRPGAGTVVRLELPARRPGREDAA